MMLTPDLSVKVPSYTIVPSGVFSLPTLVLLSSLAWPAVRSWWWQGEDCSRTLDTTDNCLTVRCLPIIQTSRGISAPSSASVAGYVAASSKLTQKTLTLT